MTVFEIIGWVAAGLIAGFIIGAKWSEYCSVPIIAELWKLVRKWEEHSQDLEKELRDINNNNKTI